MISTNDLFAVVENVLGTQRRFEGNFDEMVRAVADDKAPDAEAIARVLQDAGKTVADLQSSVERLQQRRELRKVIEESAAMERERSDLKKKIGEAERQFLQAEQDYKDTVDPLTWRLDQLNLARSAASDARRKLEQTCDDATLLGEMASVNDELRAVSARHLELGRRRDQLRDAGRSDLGEAAHQSQLHDQKFYRDRGESRLAKVKEFDKQLADLNKQRAKLLERQESIRERMIQA